MYRKAILGLTISLGLVFFLSSSDFAVAQGVQYKKKTVIDFDDDTIEGDLSRPDGEYLESRKRRKYRSLIKIRKNFRTEILQSVRGL